MGMAERAELVARLSLDDKLSGQSAKAASNFSRSMGKIGATASKGVRTTASNLGKIGLIAAGGIAAAVKGGLDSLATLESATTSLAGAIKQMGLTGKVTSGQIATWANEIEANVGAAFDDKDIAQATTTLIRFGKIAPSNIRPAMVVMTDLATKTGDVSSAAAILAKALADPAKAAGKLARAGVILTKDQQKQIATLVKQGKVGKAQALILDLLAKATKGAADASQGPYKRSLSILKDVTEDAQRALATGFLPVIEKVAKILSTELAKPETLARIKEFGQGLASGLDRLITTAQGLDWKSIGNSLKTAGDGAKTVLGAFTSAPDWVKTAVLTGWGLNKISGGALNDIFGQTIKLAFGQFFQRGSSPANPMFVASVGGLGGGAGAAAGGIGALALIGLPLLAAAAVAAVAADQESHIQSQAGKNVTGTQAIIASGSTSQMRAALAGLQTSVASLSGLQKVLYDLDVKGIKTHTEGLEAALAAALSEQSRANLQPLPAKISDKQKRHFDVLRDKIEGARIATVTRLGTVNSTIDRGDAGIILAIRQSQPVVNVKVDVSGTTVRVYQTGGTMNHTAAGSGPGGPVPNP